MIPSNYRTINFVEAIICASKLTKLSELGAPLEALKMVSVLSEMKIRYLAIGSSNPAGIAGVSQALHRDYRPYVSFPPSAILVAPLSPRYASPGIGIFGNFINFA